MEVQTKKIGATPVRQLLPKLEIIAKHWGLELKRVKDFKKATEILIKNEDK